MGRRRVESCLLAEGKCLRSQHPLEIAVGERSYGYPAAERGKDDENAVAPGIRPEAEGVGLEPAESLGVVRRRQGGTRAIGASYFLPVRRGFSSLATTCWHGPGLSSPYSTTVQAGQLVQRAGACPAFQRIPFAPTSFQ
ncbi:hypothetical protein LCGC14_0888980 [marine sediment metagenome]|uniref:Uncharacterized protein n=1 Tax=marine sediment metagenome TaxID=412755 RepID=A0A0F9RJ25_9ZZZZ